MPRTGTIVFAVALLLPIAGGLAALARSTPIDFGLTLLAAPTGLLVAGGVLAARGRGAALDGWATRLLVGAGAGIAATLVYDLWRVGVRDVWGVAYDPFRVQPVFGQILTGLPTTHPATLAAGWGHHLWLGALAGMVFAAIAPRGGALAGVAFAAAMQIGRWAMYPSVFTAGLTDREFVANGVLGQIVWGAVLGLSLALAMRRTTRAAA